MDAYIFIYRPVHVCLRMYLSIPRPVRPFPAKPCVYAYILIIIHCPVGPVPACMYAYRPVLRAPFPRLYMNLCIDYFSIRPVPGNICMYVYAFNYSLSHTPLSLLHVYAYAFNNRPVRPISYACI